MSALAIIAITAWVLCWVLGARVVFRAWVDDGMVDDWSDLLEGAAFACLAALIGGPFITSWRLFMSTIGSRVDPIHVADVLAGKPRQTPEQRIRELEARNAALERELGIR